MDRSEQLFTRAASLIPGGVDLLVNATSVAMPDSIKNSQVLPGNVARMIAGQFATPDVIAAIQAKLGLNDPLVVQYWRWASRIVSGDLGQSLIMERPIGPMLRTALANSATLAAVSLVVIAIGGIGLGIIAAIRHNTALDHGISVVTFLGISVPEFFWGIVLILVFLRGNRRRGHIEFRRDAGCGPGNGEGVCQVEIEVQKHGRTPDRDGGDR